LAAGERDAGLDSLADLVVETRLAIVGDDFQLGLSLGWHRLSSSPRGGEMDQRQRRGWPEQARPWRTIGYPGRSHRTFNSTACTIAFLMALRAMSVTGNSGDRTSSLPRPSSASPHLAPARPGSMKIA